MTHEECHLLQDDLAPALARIASAECNLMKIALGDTAEHLFGIALANPAAYPVGLALAQSRAALELAIDILARYTAVLDKRASVPE